MRTIIVGDIHGCYKELLELLDKVGLSTGADRLVFVGDLIDRGEDPYLVIEHIKGLMKIMGGRCVVIRGNHEEMMLNSIYDHGEKFLWLANGAAATIKSFYRHKRHPNALREWLESTRYYYETDDLIVAHAGMDPGGPDRTSPDTFVWDRTIADYGTYSGKLFVYGHTPMRAARYQDGLGRRVELCDDIVCTLPPTGSICIDTGCVYGNRLTAMVINEAEEENGGEAGVGAVKEGLCSGTGTFVLKSVASGRRPNLLA